jgi:hypothetical protein
MKGLRIPALALVGCLVPAGAAQSIYVDLDVGIGGPQLGGGAPSSAFGGAAGVPGFWNAVEADSGSATGILDTGGHATTVSMTWTGGGGGFGLNNPINTGDYNLLLNDAERNGSDMSFVISGLLPGPYRVFTFAVEPHGDLWTTNITIAGSVEGTRSVTGPMPGNQLIEGVTHSIHNIELGGGPLTIEAVGAWPRSYVNGFQILAVPEPTTISAFSFCLAGFLARRKKGM